MGNSRKTTEQFREEMRGINDEIEILGEYEGCNVKIKFKCECGEIGYKTPGMLLLGSKCYKCANTIRSKANTKTNETFLEEIKIKNPNVEILSEYIANDIKVKYKCSCGRVGHSTPHILLKGKACSRCCHEQSYIDRTKTHEDFVDEMRSINPEIAITGNYVNSTTKIEYRCVCGEINSTKPRNLLMGKLCRKCGTKKTTILTHDEFVEKMKLINPKIEILSKYINTNTEVQYKCICGNTYNIRPKRLLGGHLCFKCGRDKLRKSHEQFISEIYDINPNIKILSEYKGLRYKIKYQCVCGSINYASPWHLLHGGLCMECANNMFNNVRFEFEDGEKAMSKYEHMFSFFLRSLGLSYGVDYFRDVEYKTFTDTNLKSKLNCDYQIKCNDGRTFYVELAGMIDGIVNENCYINNIPIEKNYIEEYRKRLNIKHELFEQFNIEHYILLPSQMNKTTYKKLFDLEEDMVV